MTERSNWFAGDAALARRVDGLCDRLSAAWRSGERPELEQFLTDVPDGERPLVLRELLATELECRRQHGESPSADEYRKRFPSDPTVIDAAFATLDGRKALGETRTHLGGDAVGSSTISDFGESGGDRPRAVAGLTSTRLGDYDIIRELGKGGMGIVYEARQRSADRLVALKLIRPERLEALSEGKRKEVIERFRTEAHAAARLDHEHLVTVFDVGQIEGRPYYSMRYVPGKSLAEILLAGPLQGTKGAAYLEPVARALQAAHSAGILHRDLKPHNILIDERTDRPLVADFGLAKLLEGGQDVTVTGEVFGSPPYMAPEQALDSAKASTASDVYGLGATLYHALAGRPPFQAASAAETLRQVIDVEPAPPRQLNPAIDRDLETICLKCLQKEPDRRYATAEELADDLRRFLDDRPILARRAGAVERTWRWARRNPKIAVLAALLFLSLSAGLIGVGSQWNRAEANLLVANEQRGKAEESLVLAQSAVNDMLQEVGYEGLRDIPEMEPVRLALLEKAKSYFERFLERGSENPNLARQVGVAHSQLGEIYRQLGQDVEAEAEFRDALVLQRALLASSGEVYDRQELMDTLGTFGTLRMKQARMSEAEDFFLEAREIGLGLEPSGSAEERLFLSTSQVNLGVFYRETGQLERANTYFDEALELLEGLLAAAPESEKYQQALVRVLHNLAFVRQNRGRFEESQQAYERSASIMDKLATRKPASVDYRQGLARTKNNLGWLFVNTGRPKDAFGPIQQAIEVLEKLAREHPGVPRHQFELARSRSGLALAQLFAGEPAESTVRQGLEVCQSLNRQSPGVPEYEDLLGILHNQLGWQLQLAGQAETAQSEYDLALPIQERLVERHPHNPEYSSHLAQTLHQLGMMYEDRDPPRSMAYYDRALAIRRSLVESSPDNPKNHDDLAWTHRNLSSVHRELNDGDEERRQLIAAVDARRRLVEGWPELDLYRSTLADDLYFLTLYLEELNDDEAIRFGQELVELRAQLAKKFPGDLNFRRSWIMARIGYFGDLIDAGQIETGMSGLDDLVTELEQNLAAAPDTTERRADLAMALTGRADSLDHERSVEPALADLSRALSLVEGNAEVSIEIEIETSQALVLAGRRGEAVALLDPLVNSLTDDQLLARAAWTFAKASQQAFADPCLAPLVRLGESTRHRATAFDLLYRAAKTDSVRAVRTLRDADLWIE